MQVFDNGHRYNELSSFEKLKNNPYDYKNKGLIQHLMSPKIYNTKNPVLRYILKIYEQSIVYVLQYIDILKNYKNYTFYNR
jgi:hypothetical protein